MSIPWKYKKYLYIWYKVSYDIRLVIWQWVCFIIASFSWYPWHYIIYDGLSRNKSESLMYWLIAVISFCCGQTYSHLRQLQDIYLTQRLEAKKIYDKYSKFD